MAERKNSKKPTSKLKIETIVHDEAKRKNIPTAEYQSIMQTADRDPIQVEFSRRNHDLDPQLMWRGKDQQNWSELVVAAPPLYIQEKVHPKVIIDDLMRRSKKAASEEEPQFKLFEDFNGLPSEGARTEFYQHDSHWSNRMILGDSLQVMASLSEREGLRGKVQCIYIDPPYGIKFNSNFQWSTTSTKVKDGKADHITREPEQVKAFRDTWRDGIHSYLTYLRDRLTVAHDLLHDSGSIFVQIGDENMHRVRTLLDEVFGDSNFVSVISYKTSIGLGSELIDNTCNYLVWYSKNKEALKFRPLFKLLDAGKQGATRYKTVRLSDLTERSVTEDELDNPEKLPKGARLFRDQGLTSRSASATTIFPVLAFGREYRPSTGGWRTSEKGLLRALRADRVLKTGQNISYRKYFDDFCALSIDNFWADVTGGITSRADPKVYVVQTATSIIERCILMTTDPGDLVLDPTCGAGTSAMVSEQWGRRWITIDTSRVALALARARIMGAKYPYYLLADSREGQLKEAELSQTQPSSAPVHGHIRQGFVYERLPHVTLKSIANNSEIDVIFEKWEKTLDPILEKINRSLKTKWEEWEIPRQAQEDWSKAAKELHQEWWKFRIQRQQEIDMSISAKAENELLYDKPVTDKRRIRVAGPFTVESVSPHKVLGVNVEGEILDSGSEENSESIANNDFVSIILENLRIAGVQQAHKEDKISFTSIVPWPGKLICAEAYYQETGSHREKRAGIFIGPEFGTVSRVDLVEAAKEAGESDFDVLIACAFNFDARASDFNSLARIPVLKARMNADLHMAEDLKNTGKGNLFVIFGEPDIEIKELKSDQIKVKINGVDVFHPNTGEVRSDSADGIACWMIDTDYNEESFFVRQAYFLGAGDPYKALKKSLKAEIEKSTWDTLNSDTSRSFDKPDSGRIAVKVINHLGDEVMKVFKVN